MALAPGSINLVGFKADVSDGLVFVVLEPVLAGTVITITYSSFDGTSFADDGKSWVWTANADLAAGTEVTIKGLQSGELPSSDTGTVVESDKSSDEDVTGSVRTFHAYSGSSTNPALLGSVISNGIADASIAAPAVAGGAAPAADHAFAGYHMAEISGGGSSHRASYAAFVAPGSSSNEAADTPAQPSFGDGNDNYTNSDLWLGTLAMKGGDDALTNSGVILGSNGVAVDMGDGNDNVTLEDGSQIFGEIRLGAGNDTLTATDIDSDLNIDAGAGNDTITSGLGDDRIRGGAGDDVIDGSEGDDALQGDAGNDRLLGGLGDDVLSGGDGNDTLDGGEGNDTLYGDAGNDTIDGGEGDDRIYAGGGADFVYGGAGNDRVYGSDGNDEVHGGDGNDELHGEGGDDRLYGDAGNDTFYGGVGNDTLSGGEGNDRLYGQDGNDVLIGGSGNDVLNGGTGIDTADYSDDTVGVTVNLQTGTATGANAGNDTLSDIENAIGGSGDDTLIGNAAVNRLEGGAGNDRIVVGAGDTAIGGIGNDSIEATAGGTGTITVDGGEGDDTIRLMGTGTGSLAAATAVERLIVEGGIWAVAGSAVYNEITIKNGGAVSSGLVVDKNDQFSIEAGGKLSNSLTWAGGGNAVVNNAGEIKANGRIFDVAAGATGSLVINNLVGGLMSGALTPTGAGHADATVTLNNAGVIESAVNGRVIDFRDFDANGAAAIINNLAGGIIRKIGGNDGDLIRPGVDGTINNWGTITVSVAGVDAIDFQADLGGKVNNYAGGLIEGTKHAITGDQAVTVRNEGTIVGKNGSAVNIDNGDTGGTVDIRNYGVMEGRSAETTDSDGDAVDVDGLAFIMNYGRIAGMGAEGKHDLEPNVSEGIAIGGGTILNYGANAEIYGYGRAIQVDNSSNENALGTTFVNNEGLIHGDGHGPEGVAPEEAARFDLRGNEAINLVGDYADEILNQSTGRIIGGISMGGGSDRLSNHGLIQATGGSAINMGAGDDWLWLYEGAVHGAILMGDGNDLVFGTSNADYEIDAGNGADAIYMGTSTGNDHILGGAGDDIVYAALGNDVIDGGTGNDSLFGEAGNDTISGGEGDDIIKGGAGNDIIDGGAGYDVLDLSDASGPIFVDFGGGYVTGAGIDSDTFSGIEKLLFGEGANDVTGGNGDDVFDGGAGNDILTGGAGDDRLYGGLGDDTLNGGSGDDEELDGGEGNDVISGGSGDDHMFGGLGNDTLKGGSGDDEIVGGAGDDIMNGGSGTDVFHFAAGFGNDTITDFGASEADIIRFDAGVFADFDAVMAHAVQSGGDVVITVDADNSITLSGTNLASLMADDFRFI